VEELFFRGLLLRSLLRRVPQGWSVGISALLFALLHLEPLQIPGLFAIGVILAVLALRSGRLGPGICAHAAFNAIAVTALALK
jgi:membrane protease YdiL (CAAX protease family)